LYLSKKRWSDESFYGEKDKITIISSKLQIYRTLCARKNFKDRLTSELFLKINKMWTFLIHSVNDYLGKGLYVAP